jgi:hypothetical protein
MRAFRSFLLVQCVGLMAASVAFGQQSVSSASGLERGYMTAAAGAAFADQRSPTFAVEFGERINSRVQAFATLTYFDDLMSDATRDDLAQLGTLLTNLNRTSWEFEGRDRGIGFSGGAKYLLVNGGSFRPYVGAAPGVLGIRRRITERDLGDVSNPVLAVFGAPDGFVDASKITTLKPMVEYRFGVGLVSGRTYVDVGYRYRQVFRSRESFSFGQFNAGIGMRF